MLKNYKRHVTCGKGNGWRKCGNVAGEMKNRQSLTKRSKQSLSYRTPTYTKHTQDCPPSAN